MCRQGSVRIGLTFPVLCSTVVLVLQTLSLAKMSLASLVSARSPTERPATRAEGAPFSSPPAPEPPSSSSGLMRVRRLEISLARISAIFSVVRSAERFLEGESNVV